MFSSASGDSKSAHSNLRRYFSAPVGGMTSIPGSSPGDGITESEAEALGEWDPDAPALDIVYVGEDAELTAGLTSEAGSDENSSTTPTRTSTSLPSSRPRVGSLEISTTDPHNSYTFLQCIGRGGFGSVHLCVDNDSGEEYAIKVVSAGQDEASVAREVARELEVYFAPISLPSPTPSTTTTTTNRRRRNQRGGGASGGQGPGSGWRSTTQAESFRSDLVSRHTPDEGNEGSGSFTKNRSAADVLPFGGVRRRRRERNQNHNLNQKRSLLGLSGASGSRSSPEDRSDLLISLTALDNLNEDDITVDDDDDVEVDITFSPSSSPPSSSSPSSFNLSPTRRRRPRSDSRKHLEAISSGVDQLRVEEQEESRRDPGTACIIQCKEVFRFEGKIWLVLEYMDGGSLKELLSVVNRPFQEREIAVIARHLLLGLHYLHVNRGIVHRDIKADNILCSSSGKIKFADFGTATLARKSGALHASIVGTASHMSPEQCRGERYTSGVDIWGLGITLIELAQLEDPFHGWAQFRIMSHLATARKMPTLRHRRRFSRDFNKFLDSCLKKKPGQRPSALKLLKHSFIRKAENFTLSEFLGSYIGEQQEIYDRCGGPLRFHEMIAKRQIEQDGGSSTLSSESSRGEQELNEDVFAFFEQRAEEQRQRAASAAADTLNGDEGSFLDDDDWEVLDDEDESSSDDDGNTEMLLSMRSIRTAVRPAMGVSGGSNRKKSPFELMQEVEGDVADADAEVEVAVVTEAEGETIDEDENKVIAFTFNCSAERLDDLDVWGKSDPYFVVKRLPEDGDRRNAVVVYRSRVIKNNLNPNWGVMRITSTDAGVDDRLYVKVYDRDWMKKDDLIGTFTCTLREIITSRYKSYHVVNEKKLAASSSKRSRRISRRKPMKKAYVDSGLFYFLYQSATEV